MDIQIHRNTWGIQLQGNTENTNTRKYRDIHTEGNTHTGKYREVHIHEEYSEIQIQGNTGTYTC